MTQNRGRLTPQQLRILGLAWLVTVLLVGACVFLAVYLGLDSRTPQVAETTGTAPAGAGDGSTPTILPLETQQGDLPTQAVPEGNEPAGGPTPLPVDDPSFGYGIQVQAHANTEQT